MTGREVLLILTSIGAIQSILIGFYLLSLERKNDKSNLLLGLLLIVLGIRVAKSTFFIFSSFTPLWLINVGFASQAASGPLLLLYIVVYKHPDSWGNRNYWHFLPAILIILFSWQLTLESFWYRWGYTGLLYYSLGYILWANYIFFRQRNSYKRREILWIGSLIIGISLFLTTYLTNYILRLNDYILAPIIYALVIYIISFLILKNYHTVLIAESLEPSKKYKYLNVSRDQEASIKRRIVNLMSESKPYLDANFNVSKLADTLSIQGYTVSYILSKSFEKNFSDFVNEYRIKEAANKLLDPSLSHYKISSLAYDCGFNSLSAFNAAFKKFTGMTPSNFKNQQKNSSSDL